VRFAFSMLGLLLVVSLGPALTIHNRTIVTLPWHRLWYLPILRSAYPVRFMVFGYLTLAVMVAVWLAGPWPAPAWFRQAWQRWLLAGARWLLALLALAVLVADLPEMSARLQPSPAFMPACSGRRRPVTGSGWPADTSTPHLATTTWPCRCHSRR
jgi:hypothetical protein